MAAASWLGQYTEHTQAGPTGALEVSIDWLQLGHPETRALGGHTVPVTSAQGRGCASVSVGAQQYADTAPTPAFRGNFPRDIRRKQQVSTGQEKSTGRLFSGLQKSTEAHRERSGGQPLVPLTPGLVHSVSVCRL